MKLMEPKSKLFLNTLKVKRVPTLIFFTFEFYFTISPKKYINNKQNQ